MARVTGPYKFIGTFGGLTFYKMDGQNYVRQKSSLTKKKVMTRKAFANTRKSAELLGQASKIASKLYRMLAEERKGREVYQKITGAVKLLFKDGASEEDIYSWFKSSYSLNTPVRSAMPQLTAKTNLEKRIKVYVRNKGKAKLINPFTLNRINKATKERSNKTDLKYYMQTRQLSSLSIQGERNLEASFSCNQWNDKSSNSTFSIPP